MADEDLLLPPDPSQMTIPDIQGAPPAPIDMSGFNFNPNFDFSFPQMPSMPPAPVDPFNLNIPNLQGPPSPVSGGGGGTNTGLLAQLLSLLREGKGGMSQVAGTALPAAGVVSGIGGIIQNLTGGRPVTSQQLRSTVQESPQQRQLTGQTLSALSNLQGLAHNAELQQAVSRLASGQLPISPDLVDQVTKAFGATAGGLAQRSIEDARNRGFSGGMELLGGAGSPQYAQSLAQLQSDVSQALVNLALGLPTTAANIQSSLVNNASVPIDLQQGLLGQLQQFAGLQGGQNVNTLAPRPTLLSALQPIGQLASGLGQMGAARNMLQPQPSQSLSGVDQRLSG